MLQFFTTELSDIRLWSIGNKARSRTSRDALRVRKKLSWDWEENRAHMSDILVSEIQ